MNPDSQFQQARRLRKREEKARQIMEAAERVFSATDVTSASMEEIAREADVASGTLYNYFPGKEALFFAVFERKISKLLNDASQQWDAQTPFKERLGNIIHLHLDFIHTHKGFYEYLMSLGQPNYTEPGTFANLLVLCEKHLTSQTQAFKNAQKSGEISTQLPPAFLSRALRSLSWGMASDAVNRRTTHDLSSEVTPILELFWKGIAP